MSYSLDFRKQVFKIKSEEQLSAAAVSKRFGISVRTVLRWKKRLEPKLTRNKPATKIDMDALKKHVEDYPDAYQYERAQVFGVSPNCILYALRRLKISRKKTLFHPKSDESLRESFKEQLFTYQTVFGRPIVYIDESGFSVDEPRSEGYSAQGRRCYAGKDWHSRGRVNAIGAICEFRILNVCLFEGNVNADVFYSWVSRQLLLSLPDNAVVVMDNAAFHKRSDSIDLIEKHGHTLLFLPPYSPDLNPIEKKWAQAKRIRRKYRCDPY
jgi:transposase